MFFLFQQIMIRSGIAVPNIVYLIQQFWVGPKILIVNEKGIYPEQ